MRAACPAHLICLDLIAIISDKEYKLWSSLMHSVFSDIKDKDGQATGRYEVSVMCSTYVVPKKSVKIKSFSMGVPPPPTNCAYEARVLSRFYYFIYFHMLYCCHTIFCLQFG
jgi:hypothetical protein